MSGTMRTHLWAVLALTLLAPPSASAADQGEIAIIEDDGSIAQVIFLPDQSLAAASKIFYKTHQDRYDDLFFFWATSGAGIQQGWTVNQPVKGI